MAIKVNGTTVINDSRALQNVASVDATTATAIGAAGVGGAHTLIQAETSFTSTSYPEFDISSGGYEVYYIDLIGLQHSNANVNRNMVLSFFDSSNNRITSNSYNTIGMRNGVSYNNPADTGFIGDPSNRDWYNAPSYNGTAYVSIEVRNSNSSTFPTTISYRTLFTTGAAGSFSPRPMAFGQIFLKTTGTTPKFSIAEDNFNNGVAISGKYRAWALK